MKTLQRGFTLIELMIVVAIIGIIVALAVPAYQDYTLRSRISECASLSAATRTAIDVTVSEGATIGGTAIPATPGSIGLALSTSYQGKYAARVGYTTAGQVTCTLQTATNLGLGTQAGKTVTYSPIQRGGNLEWQVPATAQGANAIDVRYRPKP